MHRTGVLVLRRFTAISRLSDSCVNLVTLRDFSTFRKYPRSTRICPLAHSLIPSSTRTHPSPRSSPSPPRSHPRRRLLLTTLFPLLTVCCTAFSSPCRCRPLPTTMSSKDQFYLPAMNATEVLDPRAPTPEPKRRCMWSCARAAEPRRSSGEALDVELPRRESTERRWMCSRDFYSPDWFLVPSGESLL